MTLREKIEADIKAAMLAKDTIRRDVLKFIKGEIQNRESRLFNNQLVAIDDETVCSLIKRQVENLKITPTTTSSQEIDILQSYLPELMSEDEIRSVVASLKESGMNNLGQIMKHFSTNLKGKADNAMVSQIVKEVLV